jgi:hypothetical protein
MTQKTKEDQLIKDLEHTLRDLTMMFDILGGNQEDIGLSRSYRKLAEDLSILRGRVQDVFKDVFGNE